MSFEWDESKRKVNIRKHGIVVPHTERGEKIRIISTRKATKNEAKIYFDQIAD